MLVVGVVVSGVALIGSIASLVNKDRKKKEAEFQKEMEKIKLKKERQKKEEEEKKKKLEKAQETFDKIYSGICYVGTCIKNFVCKCFDYACAYYNRFEEEIGVALSAVSFGFSFGKIFKLGSLSKAWNFKPKSLKDTIECWSAGNTLFSKAYQYEKNKNQSN